MPSKLASGAWMLRTISILGPPRRSERERRIYGPGVASKEILRFAQDDDGAHKDGPGHACPGPEFPGHPCPPTVRPSGPVPGMDALETCVRSMDAPDDQMSSQRIDLPFLRAFARFAFSRFLRFFLSCGDLGPSYSSLSRTFRPASVAEDSMARKFSPLTTNTARFPRSRMQPYASETFSPDFSSALAS